MAKRFSETNKWKDEKFGDFSRDEKLAFLFLVDNCDNGGFFELNARLNSYLIGISQEDYLKCLEGLKNVLVKSKNGAKYFIKNFLLHQKNLPLNSENNAHKQIISIIKTNVELFDYDFNKLGAKQGLFSPIGKGIGNGIGNVLNNEKELENSFSMIENTARHLNSTIDFVKQLLTEFISELKAKQDFDDRTIEDLRKHFVSWAKIQVKNSVKKTGHADTLLSIAKSTQNAFKD